MSIRATSGITNLFLYNRFLNDTDDAPSTDINDTETLRYIIDETNSLIGQKCGRNFGQDTYREWVETKGMSYVVLNNYPVTQIKHCSLNGVDLCNIKATGFQVASVRSNAASITLSSIASNGDEVDTSLDVSTYTNVTSLTTAIDLIDGWEASVLSDRGGSLTQSIRPLDSGWALDEEVCLRGPYLGVDARLSYDSNCIVDFGSNYSFFSDEGACRSRWAYMHYVAGYVLPVCDDAGGTQTVEGDVPEGLTMIANRIILDTLRQRDEDSNMKSEKVGDYGYTRDGISSAVDRNWSDLLQYGRKVV